MGRRLRCIDETATAEDTVHGAEELVAERNALGRLKTLDRTAGVGQFRIGCRR